MKKKVLDITNLKCPISFLKTKEFIKENKKDKIIIVIKGKKDFSMLANSLSKNFELKVTERKNNVFEIQLN
tara:strand:- start:272 stop:484 length:213 start_codon:yes stop_codon:yes gene_type:complete